MKNTRFAQTLRSRRFLTLAIIAVLVLFTVVGTTVAYIKISSNSVENTFGPSEIKCSIEETVEDGVKSSVTVKNTGKTSAFVRVAVIANTVDGEGCITGTADVSGSLCGEGWVKSDISDMYYYYTSPIAPEELTSDLLKGEIDLTGIQVTILAEVIQSEPVSAVTEAWGVVPTSLGSN